MRWFLCRGGSRVGLVPVTLLLYVKILDTTLTTEDDEGRDLSRPVNCRKVGVRAQTRLWSGCASSDVKGHRLSSGLEGHGVSQWV